MIELHSDEKVVLEKRRYWLPFAAEGLTLFITAVIPFSLIFFGGSLSLPEEISSQINAYKTFAYFLAAGWFLIVWVIFFVAWTNYYLDVLLVTSKRVVDIEQLGLFSRDEAELRIENIQDIKVEIAGVLASILHFGNIHIQTAGQSKEFIIKNLHDPQGVKDEIMRQHDALSKN